MADVIDRYQSRVLPLKRSKHIREDEQRYLARLTGQRHEDLLSLRREQVTDADVIFRQGKTGAGVLIEWTDELHAVIDRAWKMSPQIPRDYVIRKPGNGTLQCPRLLGHVAASDEQNVKSEWRVLHIPRFKSKSRLG